MRPLIFFCCVISFAILHAEDKPQFRHELFYLRDLNDKTPLTETSNNRKTDEWEFLHRLRLEDDFTFHARQKLHWKIESLDRRRIRIIARLM
jgi:hypothetical protein